MINKINHQAVIGASVINFLFAFIWYGPLFGAAWAKGAEVSNAGTPPVWATITSFLVGLLSCYGIALFMKWSNQQGMKKGLMIGSLVAVFFLLQVVIGPWLFADRFLLFAVNMPYFALSTIIAGGIIGAWPQAV